MKEKLPILARRELFRISAGVGLLLAGCGGGRNSAPGVIAGTPTPLFPSFPGSTPIQGTYTLSVSMDNNSVQKINATGQKVTLIKVLGEISAVTQPPAVAWLAFSPSQNNVIRWATNYYLYSTLLPVTANNPIFVNSVTTSTVRQGTLYGYQNNLFVEGDNILPLGQYGVLNQQQDNINFGLLQEIYDPQGNPLLSPIVVAPALYNQIATFSPLESVYVFLSYPTTSGSVVAGVTSNPLLVTLTSVNSSATLGFDGSENEFYLRSE